MSDKKVFTFGSGRTQRVAGKFELNGQEFTVRALNDSNVAYLIAAINDTTDPMRVVTKVIDFMDRALIKEDGPRFEKVVLDPESGLKIEELLSVFQHVLTLAASPDPNGEEVEDEVEDVKPAPKRRAAATR